MTVIGLLGYTNDRYMTVRAHECPDTDHCYVMRSGIQCGRICIQLWTDLIGARMIVLVWAKVNAGFVLFSVEPTFAHN